MPMKTVVRDKRKESVEQDSDFFVALDTELQSWAPNTGKVASRYESTSIAGVFNFKTNVGSTIQLVATISEPIEAILGFHSTLVLNIASAFEIISLYPATSFLHNQSLYLLDTKIPKIRDAMQKYENRKWDTVTMLPATTALDYSSELSLKTRWIGDDHCWILKLPFIPGLPSAEHDRLRVTSWRITYAKHDEARMVKNRLDKTEAYSAYTVTWQAEMAVLWHPCFHPSKNEIETHGYCSTDDTEHYDTPDNTPTPPLQTYPDDTAVDGAMSELYAEEAVHCEHNEQAFTGKDEHCGDIDVITDFDWTSDDGSEGSEW
ncbi:hypothetical protein MPER_13211 [Moniliophthora perniciosa FA553]|nr:hypothetical protein MPER_13211 [Moniliophthora perniciosa FA553]